MAYRLAASAIEALEEIRNHGIDEWGEAVADRYDLLLDSALQEIGDDPQLRGSRALSGTPVIRTYPIRLSRDHVPAELRIGKPRHVVVYRVADDGIVDVLGIVHDRMLLGRAARRLAGAVRGSPKEP